MGKKKKDTAVEKKDGWGNVLTGFGGKLDKRSKTVFKANQMFTDDYLFNLYAHDGLARRIVDIVADDMTREGFLFFGEHKQIIEDEFSRLQVDFYFNTALKWKRLFGGALIILGFNDGKPLDEPLVNPKAEIQYLKVLDRTQVDIFNSIFQQDPTKPNFGEVEKFKIDLRMQTSLQTYFVHKSRVLEFKGDILPKSYTMEMNTRYWGASVLQSIHQQIADMNGAASSIQNILYEFIIGKFKFKDLATALAQGNEQLIINRMDIIGQMKSLLRAVLLDEGEDYIRDSANVSGLSDILDRIMMSLSGVSGIPLTRLFGRSPAGLNATGESDMNNYYDMVRAKQRVELLPNVYRLMELIASANNIKILPVIETAPLKQLTEKEEAELQKLKMEAMQVRSNVIKSYIENGLIDETKALELLAQWGDLDE